MAGNRMVSHDGIVVGTIATEEGHKVRVKVISRSACAQCHAKGVCTAADMEEKIIDAAAASGQSLQKGDPVIITMEEKLGWLAVFYGFFLPFILFIAVLLSVQALVDSEPAAALAGIGSLVPYYLLLYVFRHRIEKDFIFRVNKKNEVNQ